MEGGARVRVRIEANVAFGADAVPLADEQGAAGNTSRKRRLGDKVPFVPLRPDADIPGPVEQHRKLQNAVRLADHWPGGRSKSGCSCSLGEHTTLKHGEPEKMVSREMWSSPMVFRHVPNGRKLCADATLSDR